MREKRARFYPHYMLAREFPELLKHRRIIINSKKDFSHHFFILQYQADILVNHLTQSTELDIWRDSFDICYIDEGHKGDDGVGFDITEISESDVTDGTMIGQNDDEIGFDTKILDSDV